MARANVIKMINMGHEKDSDVTFYASKEFIFIDSEGIVWIKPINDIEVRFPENGCMELIFDERSRLDVMFDSQDEEDEHIIVIQ